VAGDGVTAARPTRVDAGGVLRCPEIRERAGRHHLEVAYLGNEDGLRFAERHGFVETERYLLPGDTIPWIDLRLA
jgi:hypothetical protein